MIKYKMMKLTHILKPVLLFCLVFSIQTQAQNNNFPSQERVEELLENINICKDNLAQYDSELKEIENNPDNFTYGQYLELKKKEKETENCIAQSRKELDTLRKDYPEWFNNPDAVMPLSNRQEISPRELEEIIEIDLEKEIAELKRRVAELTIPDRD
jgi:DNA repair exonuclease SbcCD ATPase subunit